MKTILVSGGNSGIGLQATREFLDRGHRVVILGRDQQKGQAAIDSFGDARNRASFLPVDLSTHAGVREAAGRILEGNEHFDVILHTAGVMLLTDRQTEDGISLAFAVNYLARYHLTQLLLPAIRRAENPRIVMMTSKIDLSTKLDFGQFPKFPTYKFPRTTEQIWMSSAHYAAHLTQSEPGLVAGVVNAGGANTGIMRSSPWYMRALAKVLVPLFFNSIQESAHNSVEASLRDTWNTATYWKKPGDFEQMAPIELDGSTTRQLVSLSNDLTGA